MTISSLRNTPIAGLNGELISFGSRASTGEEAVEIANISLYNLGGLYVDLICCTQAYTTTEVVDGSTLIGRFQLFIGRDDTQATASSVTLTYATDDVLTPGDTIELAGIVYMFVDVLDNSVPNQILIGASLGDAIARLKAAIINDLAWRGLYYSSATIIHPRVDVGVTTSTSQKFVSRSKGAECNLYTCAVQTNVAGSIAFDTPTFTGAISAVAVSTINELDTESGIILSTIVSDIAETVSVLATPVSGTSMDTTTKYFGKYFLLPIV